MILEGVITVGLAIATVPQRSTARVQSAVHRFTSTGGIDVVSLPSVSRGGRTLSFNRPVSIELSQGADGWEADVTQFGMVEFGETKEEAIDAARALLFFLWDEYATESDEALDPGARELATKLRATMRRTDDAASSA